MKITAVQRDTADTISLADNVLTINDVDYDLTSAEKLAKTTDDDDNETTASPEDQRVYLDSEGNTCIFLIYDIDRGFMFKDTQFVVDGKKYNGSNYMRFFDSNLNSIIEISELSNLLEWWNIQAVENDLSDGEYDDYIKAYQKAKNITLTDDEILVIKLSLKTRQFRQEMLKPIYDEYMATDGNTKSTWLLKGVTE